MLLKAKQIEARIRLRYIIKHHVHSQLPLHLNGLLACLEGTLAINKILYKAILCCLLTSGIAEQELPSLITSRFDSAKTMAIYSMLVLLLSNAVTLKRDKSILYSRATIIIFLCSCVLVAKSLSVTFLDRGVGLYGGLFHATPITHTFHLFIFFISAIILQLTAFYPRKV